MVGIVLYHNGDEYKKVDSKQKIFNCLDHSSNKYDEIFWFKQVLKLSVLPDYKNNIKIKNVTEPVNNHIGIIYEKLRLYKKAFEHYHIAAKLGKPFAQYNLARMYYLGRGTSFDRAQAYAWCSVSNFQGTDNKAEKVCRDILYYTGSDSVVFNACANVSLIQDTWNCKIRTLNLLNAKAEEYQKKYIAEDDE